MRMRMQCVDLPRLWTQSNSLWSAGEVQYVEDSGRRAVHLYTDMLQLRSHGMAMMIYI